MRAIVHERYGDAEVLRCASIDTPVPRDDEVLVEVRAAAIDRGTWHLMTGLPYLVRPAFGLRRPRQPVPGRDVAGTVVSAGRSVTRFRPGDEVFGIANGSLAEFAVAKESKLAPLPPGVTPEQAAAVPISGLTALQAVRDAGRVAFGHRVLVIGASGGVGTFAVQVAVAHEAEVTGMCSAAKADLVRSIGASHVVDHADGNPIDALGHFDVILDIAGVHRLGTLRGMLEPGGVLVLVGGEAGGRLLGVVPRQVVGALSGPLGRGRIVPFLSKERGDDIGLLGELVADGSVVPVIDASYPLADAAEAMRRLASGNVRGKVVITVA